MNLYMDVCCLDRPFDDQSQDRIHLEAEAVLGILGHIRRGDFSLFGSEVIAFEIGKMSDLERRERVSMLASEATTTLVVCEATRLRAAQLMQRGFKPVDALHVASAEGGSVDVFLTTDDQLLKVAERERRNLKVRVANPLGWLEEVTER